MQTLKTNIASLIIEALMQMGIEDFVVCPGSRNASFVKYLEGSKPYYLYEERSAAFFALGLSRRTKKPVAVITTSGTAAAELLPAVMEAHYTNVPLILITADRPRRFRGTGAPQSCEQVNLYGPYVSLSLDLSAHEPLDLSGWDQKSPLHLNVCLEDPNSKNEPLIHHSNNNTTTLDQFFETVLNPLIVVGTLETCERESVSNFLLEVGCPIYLEGVSGLRENNSLKHLQIKNPNGLLQGYEYPVDGVLRIGGVPTNRLWRDLEETDQIQVFSISNLPFKGLTYGQFLHTNLELFFTGYEVKKEFPLAKKWLDQDTNFQNQLQNLYATEPSASQSLIHALSKKLPLKAHIYLGNSLPIREWDLASTFEDKQFQISASRGLNGIDGQMSTFFGLCNKAKENFAILGDLTTLYDMAAPWILTQMNDVSVTVIVINNGGGKIFNGMFVSDVFQNKHNLNFKPLADMWNMEYELWDRQIKDLKPSNKPRLIEIIPDNQATDRFHKKMRSMLDIIC